MTLSDTELQQQTELRGALQKLPPPEFERLAARLVEDLLDVRIAVAKSGFQYGGDAGPAGREGRRFRLECKRYSDGGALRDRELLGEMVQALDADEALEAWVLVATCPVSEQTVRALTRCGEDSGVPVVVIDCPDDRAAPLAALCTVNPDLVSSSVSATAGAWARGLAPGLQPALASLRRELSTWYPGTQSLRLRSHELLRDIWEHPNISQAQLNQNAAGGARKHRVLRQSVGLELDSWWNQPADAATPAVLVGTEGTGKTWAALDWIHRHTDALPIILVAPSSALATFSPGATAQVKRFMSERLHELTQSRTQEHWTQRLDLMLQRPDSEGPAILLMIDGLNQNSTVDWAAFLAVFQATPFSGRIRVMATTRQHHFDEKLGKLRVLKPLPRAVPVLPYDMTAGGEFDQMLKMENLERRDIPADLLELARIPRVFPLVIQFRASDAEAGEPTVHRLLWEYGRDTFRGTDRSTFSERQWREWLVGIAKRARTGISRYSSSELVSTLNSGDLAKDEVYARLSSIVDGRFTEPSPSGGFRLVPAIVQHALGAALLAHLEEEGLNGPLGLDDVLAKWLEPIAALDEGAEILRAAVSILVQRDLGSLDSKVAGTLVTTWLQSQNLPDQHQGDLARLAPAIAGPLLDTIERSERRAHASALALAVAALRSTAPAATGVQQATLERLCQWQRTISCDVTFFGASPEMRTARLKHWNDTVGTDQAGPCRVLGHDLVFVDQHECVREQAGFRILEAFPLAAAVPAMELAALDLGLRGRSEVWEALKWTCWLNERDPLPVAKALRTLATAVASRVPEAGVLPGLAKKVASLLLRLTGVPADEDAAAVLSPKDDKWPCYDDYLKSPGREWFTPLERRHAISVLADETIPLWHRMRRAEHLWLDPTFVPPPGFERELRAAALDFPVDKLDESMSTQSEDLSFEQMETALARCAPDLFLEVARRRLRTLSTCSDEGAHWRIVRSGTHWMAAGPEEQAAAHTRRVRGFKSPSDDKWFANSQLLMLEIKDLDAFRQIQAIVLADPQHIASNIECVLRSPTGEDVDRLIAEFAAGTSKQQLDLLRLLSIFRLTLGDSSWAWVRSFLAAAEPTIADLALEMLAEADMLRLGRELLAQDWTWKSTHRFPVNQIGSKALARAGATLPFEQIASRVAPWLLLDAARERGDQPADVRLAAGIFDHVLEARNVTEPDPGAVLSVLTRGGPPYTIQVATRPSAEDAEDPAVAIERAFNAEGRAKALQAAADEAKRTIEDVRRSGGPLYLAAFDARNAASVVRHAPEVVDRWLEGLADRTLDFRRRVRLAEMVYLRLCEALLITTPERGVALWRALRHELATNYIDEAGVALLVHIVFKAPDSPPVDTLRTELASLQISNTDQDLLDLVIAARCAGRPEWIARLVDEDRASEYVWRQRRADVLAGFMTEASLPIPNAWPDGPLLTSHATGRLLAARARWREACARHWWKSYQNAADDGQALSAWTLFMASADRRAWTWMAQETAEGRSERFHRVAHAELNQQDLKRAMQKAESRYDEQFLFRQISKGTGPW